MVEYMIDLEDYIKTNSSKAIYKKREYSKNRWQHEAVVYSEELNIKLDQQWFRFFRLNFIKGEPRFRSIKEYMLSRGISNPHYFYKSYYARS